MSPPEKAPQGLGDTQDCWPQPRRVLRVNVLAENRVDLRDIHVHAVITQGRVGTLLVSIAPWDDGSTDIISF